MAISDLEIRNAWEDSLAAGFTPEQIYQGAAANFGVTRDQVDRALSNTSGNTNIASVIQELNAEISAENPTVSRVLDDGSRVVSYGDGRFAYYKPGQNEYTLYDAAGNLQGFESQRDVRGGVEYTTFDPRGQQIDKFVASNEPGVAGVLAPLALAAMGGAYLGPGASGLFSTPTAAALGSGGVTALQGGSASDILRAAALAGTAAFGIENLFPTDALTAGRTAVDLAGSGGTVDSITQTLVNQGVSPATARTIAAEALAGSSASQIASDFAGLTLGGTAAPSTVATTAATTPSNLVNVLGNTLLPANTNLFSSGAGSLLGAGVGSTLTNLPSDTTTNTTNDTQTLNVTGTNLGASTASTLTNLLGGGLGASLGTIVGTAPTSQTVEVVETKPTTTTTPLPPLPTVITPQVPRVDVTAPRDTCPAPEMQVMLADKTHKSAGDLKVGDKVLTQHEHTLEWGVYPVVYKEIIPQAKRVKVSFDDGEFIGSWDHKFFVSVDNWVTIKNLQAGDIIGGKVVKAVEDFDEGPVVFLTIDNAHTYVCQGVLSHNKTPEPPKVTPPVVITPTTPTTTPTTTTTTNNNNLDLATLLRLLTLFGGLGGMMGAGTTTTGTGTVSTPPSDTMIGSTTPQFGPDYYAAVQRYYNAYMPETPRNVATPLQQWYENKFGA